MFFKNLIFSTQNRFSFLFIDIFHGIVIPLKMVIPWKTERKEKPAEPSVSKRIPLEPRRYVFKSPVPERTCFPPTPPPSPLPKTEK